MLLGLDLSGTRSRPPTCWTASRRTPPTLPADAIVVGHGWDESSWSIQTPPSAAELDRAGGGRPVYLSQVSVHSAVVSSDAAGADADRRLPATTRAAGCGGTRTTSSAGWRWARSPTPSAIARSGPRCGGPRRSASPPCTSAAARAPPTSTTSPTCSRSAGSRTCRTCTATGASSVAPRRARELGAVGAGGDLYADGALGSQTAHLREPYLDAGRASGADRCGHGYVTAEQAGAHLIECTAARRTGRLPRHRRRRDRRPSSPGSRIAAAELGVDRDPGGAPPDRARRDPRQGADRRRSSSTASWPACSPRSTGCGAATGAMYEQRLGLERSLRLEPDRLARRGRRRARVRLRLAGHAAGPVGHRPGRDEPPQPGAADRRQDRVRRAHPGRLAGRTRG